MDMWCILDTEVIQVPIHPGRTNDTVNHQVGREMGAVRQRQPCQPFNRIRFISGGFSG
jgi:hypothetical protein